MKSKFVATMLTAVLAILTGTVLSGTENAAPTNVALLNVKGMTCDGCASQVKSTLTSVSGVKECQVDWKSGQAEVKFEGDDAKAQEFVAALNSTPFKASLANVNLAAVSSSSSTENKSGNNKVKKDKFFKAATYQCSHCKLTQTEPGKCPSCGMELAKIEETHTFACSKDSYITGAAGKCPKCSSDLVEYQVTFKCPACQKIYSSAGHCTDDKTNLKAVVGEPVQKMEKKEKVQVTESR